jgi:hypothetical protein
VARPIELGPFDGAVRVKLAGVVLAAAAAFAGAAPAAAPPFTVTVHAPTHTPAVNAPWPVTIVAKDTNGRPISGVLHMQILLGPLKVGDVDNGKRFRFAGTWREPKGKEITWPAASRGQRFALEAVVTAGGHTRSVRYWVRPR